MIVFNILFLVWYCKSFYKTRIPILGERIKHKGKEFDIDGVHYKAEKYPQPIDKQFRPWAHVKHYHTTNIIFAFTVLHWKSTKIMYSQFFMFGMFKGHWEKAQLLKEKQHKFGFVWLVAVDVLMIIVGIIGIIVVGFNLQN